MECFDVLLQHLRLVEDRVFEIASLEFGIPKISLAEDGPSHILAPHYRPSKFCLYELCEPQIRIFEVGVLEFRPLQLCS